jgi:hypothetical protein
VFRSGGFQTIIVRAPLLAARLPDDTPDRP